MTAELKKTLKQQERLSTIEHAQQKANDLKIEEAQLLANMMFSVNAIARCLTEKKLEFVTAETDEQGHVLYDLDAENKPVIRTKKVQLPLVTLQELNVQRMHVIQEYHEERRKEREAEEAKNKTYKYNDEEHTADEWAELLDITSEEMHEYLKMGADMQDVVETLAEENLKPDEKELIRQKVQEAVVRAKHARAAAAEGGNGKTAGLPGDANVVALFPPMSEEQKQAQVAPDVDLDSLTEAQMERYLETGALPE